MTLSIPILQDVGEVADAGQQSRGGGDGGAPGGLGEFVSDAAARRSETVGISRRRTTRQHEAAWRRRRVPLGLSSALPAFHSDASGDTTDTSRAAVMEGAAAKEQQTEAPAEGAEAAEGATPAWLTAAFLREALASRAEGDGAALRVRGFRAESAVGKGDNYASVLLRVRVHVEQEEEGARGKTEQRSLIVKSLPTGESIREWVEQSQLFPREERMYNVILPRMHQLLRTRLGSQPFGSLAPTAYASSLPDVMVLQDLLADGFKMANRQSGLDMEHTLLAIRVIATFHALSLVIHEEDPTSMDFAVTYTRENFELWVPNDFGPLAKNVETWPGVEKFAEKLKKFGKTALDVFIDSLDETKDRFKVLSHGDYWTSNVLYKYSEENRRPTDIRLIDFQTCQFTSMALDLHFFIFCSTRADVCTQNLDELLSVYYATLEQILRALDCEHRLVTWEELRGEVKRTMPLALVSATCFLPIALADPSEALELDKARSEEVNLLEKAVAGKTFAKELRSMLPYFEREGLL